MPPAAKHPQTRRATVTGYSNLRQMPVTPATHERTPGAIQRSSEIRVFAANNKPQTKATATSSSGCSKRLSRANLSRMDIIVFSFQFSVFSTQADLVRGAADQTLSVFS